MSLPAPWIDELFGRLMLVYGRDFIRRWEGMDLANVKASWSYELQEFDKHPASIAFALDRLPERPPNVIEFRSLARCAPRYDAMPALPPPASPEIVRTHVKRLTELSARIRSQLHMQARKTTSEVQP